MISQLMVDSKRADTIRKQPDLDQRTSADEPQRLIPSRHQEGGVPGSSTPRRSSHALIQDIESMRISTRETQYTPYPEPQTTTAASIAAARSSVFDEKP